MSWMRPASWPIDSGPSSTSPASRAARSRASASARPCRNAHSRPGPALDEAIAPRARHRARPDQARGDVGDFGKLGVVAVAVDDRLLEVRVQRRFHAREEPRAEQDALRAERSAATSPRPSAKPPAASTGTGVTASTTMGMSGMLPIQPTWPPPSVPCAMMTSAPALAARTASGTVPAMWVTLLPPDARDRTGS